MPDNMIPLIFGELEYKHDADTVERPLENSVEYSAIRSRGAVHTLYVELNDGRVYEIELGRIAQLEPLVEPVKGVLT